MTTYGMISTYPPTRSGLASFADRLRTALLADHADEVRVVRVGELPPYGDAPEAVAWAGDDHVDAEKAAAALNECDVALIQHDFGVYGGADGRDVLAVADRLRVPSIAVVHTVPADPDPREREVLEALMERVGAIAVMSEAAGDRLLAGYAVDGAKIAVIPHGAEVTPCPTGVDTAAATAYADGDRDRQAVILTWGLMRPGKGIEWGIEALAALRAAGIDSRYIVAGQTHPEVRKTTGESYRTELAETARRLGVEDAVDFDDSFLPAEDLAELISSADVVLLPYESTEQVTSGVLVQALAAGRPVVATAFPHALEILATGAGTTVAHRDAAAIAGALKPILTEPGVAASMTSRARSLAPGFDWAAVSAGYGRLASLLRAEQAQLLV